MKRIIATMLVAVAASASALAHPPNPNSNCAGLPNEAEQTVSLPDGTTLYVNVSGPSVWQESNGHAGLQTHSHVCTDKSGPQPWPVVTVAPDTQLV